jgi:hypothetical protein
MELVRRDPSLAATPVATANTMDQMVAAVAAVRRERGRA